MPPFMRCCNPFGKKNHWRKLSGSSLRTITKELCKSLNINSDKIGDYICTPCRLHPPKYSHDVEAITSTACPSSDCTHNPIPLDHDENEVRDAPEKSVAEEEEEDSYQEAEVEETISKLNKILEILRISPIVDWKDRRTIKAQERKIQEIKEAIDFELQKIFKIVKNNENDMNELIEELKEKISGTEEKSEKVQFLTMVPRNWKIRRIQSTFLVSYNMARLAKIIHTEHGIGSSPNPRLGKRLPEETITLVHNFYRHSEFSRQMPGKNDYVSVKTNGVRVHEQKRLLLGNLKELYIAYKEKYPDCKIGFSKFAELRPKECILAGAKGTHSICVCKIHQNMKLMIVGARLNELASTQTEDAFLGSYKDILRSMVCEDPTPDCYLHNCENCPGVTKVTVKLDELFEKNCIDQITYKRWTDTDGSMLETIVDSSDQYIQIMTQDLPDLLTHDFLAKAQSKYLDDTKNSLELGVFLVLLDFGQNFTNIIQDAIQNYYWSPTQVTIHPFVVYHKKNNEIVHDSFMIISECLRHDATAVNLHEKKVIEVLRSRYNVLKLIHFTDGAGAQYKNKSNFINLAHFQEDFEIEGEWNFYPTSHGKGPCDGLSGTLKREATAASLRRPINNQITTAFSLYEWATSAMPKVKFIYCSTSEYENHAKSLTDRFSKALTIDGTREFHSFVPISKYQIRCKTFSAAPDSQSIVFDIQRTAPKRKYTRRKK